jgi:hypothetical protein
MVHAFPWNEARWTEYAEIRPRCQWEDRPIDEANDYYAAHREQMDDGAVAAWPERYNVDELSAIQPQRGEIRSGRLALGTTQRSTRKAPTG